MARLLATALLLACLAAGAGRDALAAGSTRWAVVVGNNAGQARDEILRYAERDAARMAALLGEIGGVAPENLVLLRGRRPDDLREALDDIAGEINRAPGDAVVLFYYSGHADSGWMRMGGHGMRLSELRRRLETMPAKVRVAIIDACQSGAITRKKGGKVASPFLEEMPVKVRGLVILTSASAAEPAQESDVLGSSFFSHHLMSGLRGPADASGDGRVTVSEAYEHAYRYTVRETEGTVAGAQHPTFLYALEGEGEIALTALDEGRARVELGAGLHGTVLFVGRERRIEAEVVKEAGRSVPVALAPGRYEVRWRSPDRLGVAAIEIGDGETAALEPHSFAEIALAEGVVKGLASGAVRAEAPREGASPLTDVPLGGGASWARGGTGRLHGPPGEEEPGPDEGPRYDGSRSLEKRPDAPLCPVCAAATSLVLPGLPQMLDGEHQEGGVVMGLLVASVAGAAYVGTRLESGQSATVRGLELGGTAILGAAAFYTYGFALIDAFYSVTRGGPGAPDLEDLDVDVGLGLSPSLMRTPTELDMVVGGGLGVGAAVHPNVVLGLRNIGIGLGNGVTTVHFGPDLRLRGMISASVGWSASVGAVVQIHVEGDERAEGRHRPEGYDEETGWALYPYVGAGLHYFPARCWSLDFGVQGGLAVGTRRFLFDQEGTQEDLTFALEYVGGITWYH